MIRDFIAWCFADEGPVWRALLVCILVAILLGWAAGIFVVLMHKGYELAAVAYLVGLILSILVTAYLLDDRKGN